MQQLVGMQLDTDVAASAASTATTVLCAGLCGICVSLGVSGVADALVPKGPLSPKAPDASVGSAAGGNLLSSKDESSHCTCLISCLGRFYPWLLCLHPDMPDCLPAKQQENECKNQPFCAYLNDSKDYICCHLTPDPLQAQLKLPEHRHLLQRVLEAA